MSIGLASDGGRRIILGWTAADDKDAVPQCSQGPHLPAAAASTAEQCRGHPGGRGGGHCVVQLASQLAAGLTPATGRRCRSPRKRPGKTRASGSAVASGPRWRCLLSLLSLQSNAVGAAPPCCRSPSVTPMGPQQQADLANLDLGWLIWSLSSIRDTWQEGLYLLQDNFVTPQFDQQWSRYRKTVRSSLRSSLLEVRAVG